MKRVITANGEDGRSRILCEEVVSTAGKIWEANIDNWLGFEPANNNGALDIKPGHTIAQYVEIPPDAIMAEYLKAGIPGLDENGFHRTGTLDYIILVDGQLILELNEGATEINPGDIVVQRDTNHAWRNPLSRPAIIVSIMICPEQASAS